MRPRLAAGVLLALALVIPAAPAAAQSATPGLDAACRTVERKLFTDIRELVVIDLDTATEDDLQVVGTQILTAAKAESLPVLPGAMQARLAGSADDLRAFLKKGMLAAWTADLRISANRTLTGAGPAVQAAAQKALDDGSLDTLRAYLNEGLYEARALDCASQPSPTPTATATASPIVTPTVTTTSLPSAGPSATTAAVPVPTSPTGPVTPGGEAGGLPVTGADAATVAGIGGALLLLGGAGYLIGRRRRSHFTA